MARVGLTTLLVCGYSAWSLWDGYVAYPRRNVAMAWQEKLALPGTSSFPRPDPRLTAEEVERVRIGVTAGSLPAWFERPHIEHDGARYYFGETGYLAARVTDGTIMESTWTNGPRHSSADLAFQKVVGFVLLAAGICFVGFLVRLWVFEVVLDERGLHIGRRPSVSYSSMLQLRELGASGGAPYELSWRGRNVVRTLRFDAYTIAKADALARSLRERMGLETPSVPAVCNADLPAGRTPAENACL